MNFSALKYGTVLIFTHKKVGAGTCLPDHPRIYIPMMLSDTEHAREADEKGAYSKSNPLIPCNRKAGCRVSENFAVRWTILTFEMFTVHIIYAVQAPA